MQDVRGKISSVSYKKVAWRRERLQGTVFAWWLSMKHWQLRIEKMYLSEALLDHIEGYTCAFRVVCTRSGFRPAFQYADRYGCPDVRLNI